MLIYEHTSACGAGSDAASATNVELHVFVPWNLVPAAAGFHGLCDVSVDGIYSSGCVG